MEILRDWRNYPKAKSKFDLIPNKIFRSWRQFKKLVIWYKKNGHNKIIHFGDTRYSNYGVHSSTKRLRNYLQRSGNIRDAQGRLTRNNPTSANYWSRKILWNKKNNPII